MRPIQAEKSEGYDDDNDSYPDSYDAESDYYWQF